ncbi:MAG: hypothetical protein ACJ79V_04295, partial [Myxococcales bacterium]
SAPGAPPVRNGLKTESVLAPVLVFGIVPVLAPALVVHSHQHGDPHDSLNEDEREHLTRTN